MPLNLRRHRYPPSHADIAPTAAACAAIRDIVEHAVVPAFKVDAATLRRPTRGPAGAARARQIAMYLAHVVAGLTLSDVGRVFGRDRTTVAHACMIVEDGRDDPRLDRALDVIEAVIRRVLAVAAGMPRSTV